MRSTKPLGLARGAMACVLASSLLAMTALPSGVAFAGNDGTLSKAASSEASTQAMHRLYNPNSGEHFYTAHGEERDNAVRAGWSYEGIGWEAPITSDVPVFRLYSGTDHHYTMSEPERDALVKAGWSYEGIGWYSDAEKRTPLYRQFNPNVDPSAPMNNSGSHNYTTSLHEHNSLVGMGWSDEGIGWYGVRAASGNGNDVQGDANKGSSTGTSSSSRPAVRPNPGDVTKPTNSGAIDIKNACYGQDTPGLVSLDEAISYNQLTFDEATDKSTAVTISQETIPYLHTTDYGRPVDLQLELLTPSTAKAGETPLVVWINGGGFTSSDAAKGLDTRLALAKAGYVVASVQHRTSAVSNFPAPLQDIKAAIRFLKANASKYKFDSSKVAIGGNSSGGYYATMVGVTSNLKSISWPNRQGKVEETPLDVGANLDQSSAVNAVIDFYGVSDLTVIGSGLAPEIQESHRSPATTEALLLNGAAAAQKGVGVFEESMNPKVSAASPFSYIDANTPPFIMFHGTADTLVSPVATKMLEKRLQDAGVQVERHVIKGAGHGGNEFLQATVNDRVVDFLGTYAHRAIGSAASAVDLAKGTAAWKAADLPTLEDAVAGAETVVVDPGKWVINQVRDIPYKTISNGNTYTTLKMNLLLPSNGKSDGPRPVLYCAACGGFNKSNPSAMQYLRYAERGYIVAVSEIRVTPSVTNPAPLQDAKAGVRWLRAHAGDYGLDPKCIIATGSSAGGYMGVMLGVLGNTTQYSNEIKFDVGDNLEYSSSVQGVLDFYGVSDLTIIGAGLSNYDVHDSASNTEALLVNGTAFGKNPGGSVFDDLDKTAIFSPFTYLDGNDVPFLMFHGTVDQSVSPIATMELYLRTTALGIPSERYSIVGAGHGGWQMETKRVHEIVDAFMDNIVALSAKG